ncbi:MAG: cyclic nucleotide-binding domain-containing protein [Candidatus Cloacimonadaceae bacterium]|nr:cyclic nucleotide-binding domain-containing protein [Candidatus Cloacimonadota bacterium]MDY0128367.1 cyclic nucleotide-binding domain-containing protein [Candidatus Cloacimonadaceae bacterium]MCB5254405.1 cyclic nucleotide-binding domain-containing protein [Candidatus Cloacimonadota bacterium]MCK9178903.1 cyclic nucleotide-binding domain-containing protein [Candidatus Cloacimonadota bacterium]MCK9243051.1 cyclic nucleotide-binding domain-containing protein [Candidatus Cloacimonadota bacteri
MILHKLNEHPLYCYMNPQEIASIEKVRIEQTFIAHESIIAIGERNRDLMCLDEGSVSIQVEDTQGTITEVARLHEGSLIGEMNYIIPTRRTANVVSLTEVVASYYPYAELCALLAQQPILAAKLFAALNIQLQMKLRRMLPA